jgi:CRP/FNR family cyclic AMP-dependent transcriptional regulator
MRKALYILGDLNDGDVAWLAEAGERQSLPSGSLVIRSGEPVDALYIVTDGALEVALPNGTRLAELGPGDILGEMSLIEKRPPTASVRALQECRVLAVPQVRLRDQLDRDQGFAARFYRAIAVFLSDRLRSTVGQLGYGAAPADAEEAFELENELDEGLLDNLHVAGDRMLRLIAILDGRRV